MSQTYDPLKPTSGATSFGQLYQVIRDHIAAAISNFSGTAFPASPVAGQACYRTDRLTTNGYPKCYKYSGNTGLGESGWVEDAVATAIGEEVYLARGTKSTLNQRLDVALNEDGTLKASTTLNPSQWYLPSLTFTYVSTTSFTVNGDQTDIYKAGRRLKINLSGSTVYSEVVSASYSSNTTVQVLDAVLNATLVSVEHSLFLPDWEGKSAISPRMASNRRVRSVSADITTTLNDDIILVDASGGARVITILAAATLGAGRRQKVIKIDSSVNAVTIDPNGSETINGNATYAITVPLTGVEFESDGTNLRTTDDQTAKVTAADILSDFVVTGLLGTDPGASLAMTIPPGIAYVMGRRVVKLSGASDLTRTYTASKDTYVDISHTGAITYTEVNNGAGAPSVATNSIRLMKVVTNATEITSVTDLRVLAGISKTTDGANSIKTKIVDIGDWNMDTTSSKTVAHGVTANKIRSVSVMIRDDTDGFWLSLTGNQALGGAWDINNPGGGGTLIDLSRITSGPFDNASYDSTSYNRGWVVITYIE
jgi:hypothetical protein